MSASTQRYSKVPHNRVGTSGLTLPAISLGMWHNFGPGDPLDNQRALLRTAFDNGITHFDLADNYGGGAAERHVGNFLKTDFKDHRDELIISTKAGHPMWDGPYGGGAGGGSRKHLIAGIDQSLMRLQLEYVDIFYHHTPDADTPLRESVGACADIVRQGKALYIGISNYDGERSREMVRLMAEANVPCVINQIPFSMLDRNAERSGEFAALAAEGLGAITFSPLAQGLLTDRYLDGIPANSRAGRSGTCLEREAITPSLLATIRGLHAIAQRRGQSLAQMVLCWNLSFEPVASVLIGASRPQQIIDNIAALDHVTFADGELRAIDQILAH